MAGKKAKSELESIRTEINELTEAIYALRQHVAIESAATAVSRQVDGTGRRSGTAVRSTGSETGTIDVSGSIQIARHGDEALAFQWESAGLSIARILDQDHDQLARVLAAIGHRQRLAILNSILSKPSSAADLVADLQLGTTGAAYHHLNVLQTAGLVKQEERGIFAVNPERVATIVTILASTSIPTRIGVATSSVDESLDGEEAEPKRKSSKKKATDE